jgi:hypothetical protein
VCEGKDNCGFEGDLKDCALKHIGEARKLISKGKFEDADVELNYAEKHLKEKAYSTTTLDCRSTNSHSLSLTR